MAWPRAPRAMAPLRHRGYRLLVAGQLTSNVGDACYAVALPWYVLATHGGAALLGIVLAAYGVPRTALISGFGWWASDRWRPQTVMLAADAVRVLAAAVSLAVMAAASSLAPRGAARPGRGGARRRGRGVSLPASFSVIPLRCCPPHDLQAGNAPASGGAQLAMLGFDPAAGGLAGGARQPGGGVRGQRGLVRGVRRDPHGHARASRQDRARSTRRRSASPREDAGPGLRALLRAERVLLVLVCVNLAANLGSAGLDGVALPALAHGPLHASAQGYGAILAGSAAWGAARHPGGRAGGLASRGGLAVTGSLAFLAESAAIAVTPFLGSVAAVGRRAGGARRLQRVRQHLHHHRVPAVGAARQPRLLLTACCWSPASAWPRSRSCSPPGPGALGPASFFPVRGGPSPPPITGGLTQRSWRDFSAPPPRPQRPGRPARPPGTSTRPGHAAPDAGGGRGAPCRATRGTRTARARPGRTRSRAAARAGRRPAEPR